MQSEGGSNQTSSGRPEALMPEGFVPMEIVPARQTAMGDHQHQGPPGQNVTVHATQVQVAGLSAPDAMALVPTQPNARAGSGSPERATLRSEVAHLSQMIQQHETYANTVYTEQRQ